MAGFDLKGTSDAPLVVAISIEKAPQGTTLSIGNHGSARLEFGYTWWGYTESVVFSGSTSDVAQALRAIRINSTFGGPVTLKASVTVDETGFVYDPAQSRFYSYVQSPGIKWTDALAEAETKTFRGVKGHLAVPASDKENVFLSRNIEGASNVWIAATDQDNEGEFKWAAGDEKGTTFWKARCAANAAGSADSCTGANNATTDNSDSSRPKGTYREGVNANPAVNKFSEWDKEEPNNWGGATTPENYVATNWRGGFGLWNDLPNNTGAISGYVVEFPNVKGKPFKGVSVASQTYNVEGELSPKKPKLVKAKQTKPGTYKVTWEAANEVADLIGYRVTSTESRGGCFVKPNKKRSCVFSGVLRGVTPIFKVEAATKRFKNSSGYLAGQSRYGDGVRGTASTAPGFVTFGPPDGTFVRPDSTINVNVSGVKNAKSWTLTNVVDGTTLASGTFKSGKASGSVSMPNRKLFGWTTQINVKLTIDRLVGAKLVSYYSLFIDGIVAYDRTSSQEIFGYKWNWKSDGTLELQKWSIRKMPYWLDN